MPGNLERCMLSSSRIPELFLPVDILVKSSVGPKSARLAGTGYSDRSMKAIHRTMENWRPDYARISSPKPGV